MVSSGMDAGCYVYTPETKTKRKTSHDDELSPVLSKERLDAFHQIWAPVNEVLQNVLSAADASTVEQICDFLTSTAPQDQDRIPAGLITTTTAGSLFEEVKNAADKDILFISVPAAQCTNLKSVLRCIASSVTVETETRLLNYDLDALRIFMDAQQYTKVVVYFGNGESLHGGVLSELVDVLDSYRARIPLLMIFETAVSVDLFQEKLTQRARRQLRGTPFATASAGEVVERIFESLVTDDSHRLLMGSNLASMLLDRQAEHMQSAFAFVQEMKYMYMMHFHRNALSSILLSFEEPKGAELLQAARQSKSFKAHIQELKNEKASRNPGELLKNDKAMSVLLQKEINEGYDNVTELLVAARMLKIIHDHASPKAVLPWSRLYIQAMADELGETTLEHVRTAFLAIPSDNLLNLLQALLEVDPELYRTSLEELQQLIAKHEADQEPLRTAHDKSHETTRTEVTGKRITLSKTKATLSKKDEEYTVFVEDKAKYIFDRISNRLVDPRASVFHEVYLFDLRVPIREAFAPRPRYALEHALTVPGAYLACECCDPEQRVLNAEQPATAILYQLYLESGAIVNIADLWAAFDAIITSNKPVANSETEGQDENELASFYRALAELKYLGMIKASRKRADHLVKMKFIGL